MEIEWRNFIEAYNVFTSGSLCMGEEKTLSQDEKDELNKELDRVKEDSATINRILILAKKRFKLCY